MLWSTSEAPGSTRYLSGNSCCLSFCSFIFSFLYLSCYCCFSFCFRFLFIKFSLVFVCMFVCFCIRSILCTCVLMYSASIYGVYMSRDPNMPFKFNIHTGNGSGRGVLMTTMKYHKNMTFLFYRNLHVM